jgi:hypothetical protein
MENMMRSLLASAGLAICLTLPAEVPAVKKCVDAEGKITYSDTWCRNFGAIPSEKPGEGAGRPAESRRPPGAQQPASSANRGTPVQRVRKLEN